MRQVGRLRRYGIGDLPCRHSLSDLSLDLDPSSTSTPMRKPTQTQKSPHPRGNSTFSQQTLFSGPERSCHR